MFLKCKGWYYPTKEFISWEEVLHGIESVGYTDFISDCELLLSTYLHDKNGREIYEGDIIAIEVHTTKLHNYINYYLIKYGIAEIQDNEGYGMNIVCGFYRIKLHGDPENGFTCGDIWHMDDIDKSEYVVNIYENKKYENLI